jgi:methionyl aminopeptidase
VQVTHDALFKGIEAVKPGNTFGDIGHAIQSFVEKHRMSVVRDFCGHGLGQVFHAPPNVLHYGRPGTGPVLEEGMFFTIEPMVNLGRPETKVLADDWTAVTRDKSLSAQFEHSSRACDGERGRIGRSSPCRPAGACSTRPGSVPGGGNAP